MAGLGETASVIAVLQLSGEIIKYIGSVKDASSDRKLLRDSIRACRHILQDLKDEADDSEEGKAWTSTIEALELPDGPLGRLQKILVQVETKLQAKDGLRSSLKWPFREKDVRKLIEAIEIEKGLLQLALSKNSGKLLQEISAHTKENIKRLVDLTHLLQNNSHKNESGFQETKEKLLNIEASQIGLETVVQDVSQLQLDEKANNERRLILDWLSPTDYALQQQDVISRRQEGTGSWLLNSDSYRTWLSSSKQTLFCPGIPGAGKTIIASIINADLWEQYHNNPTIGMAFFFCDFRRQELDTIDSLLAGLLRQLAAGRMPKFIKDLYDEHGKGQRRPPLTAILGALHSISAMYSKVFIVVDGLDECQADNGCRTRLLSELLDLQQKKSINLLAISRPIPEVTKFFEGCPVQEVRANNGDVQIYLHEQIHRLPGFVQNNPTLQIEIQGQILKAVDGMFLLAQLHIDSLVGKRSVKAIRTALGNITTGSEAYDSAYTAAMERIEGQAADQEELAKQTLAWITCARSPLSPLQLQEALGVEVGEEELDPENHPDIGDVVTACAGLVTIDKETEVIRLVYYTTQKYFERTQQHWFPEAQAMITNVCTTYLSSPNFLVPPEQGEHPLFHYAASNWGHHARLAPLSLSHVIAFLRRPAHVIASAREIKSLETPDECTGLLLAAYFGLEEAANVLLQQSTENYVVTSVKSTTPLRMAILRNDVAMVKLFLESHHNFNYAWDLNISHLLAVHRGSETMVDLFLAHIKVRGLSMLGQKYDISPVHEAVTSGDISILEKYLNFDKLLVNFSDGSGETPLHKAIRRGSLAMVNMLLNANAIVEAKDRNGYTPLRLATILMRVDIVKSLLQHNADVHCNTHGETILLWAVRQFYLSTDKAKLLLHASLNAQNKENLSNQEEMRSEVFWDYDLMNMFFLAGAGISDSNNYSAYSGDMWAEFGLKTVGKLLLQWNTDNIDHVHEKDAALYHTAYWGHDDMVALLLEHGANPYVHDRSGQTAFSVALERLLEFETSSHAKAAEKCARYTRCVELLEAKATALAQNTPEEAGSVHESEEPDDSDS